MKKTCEYSITLPPSDGMIYCNLYSKAKRHDGRLWAHWPLCNEGNCPLLHTHLITDEAEFPEEVNQE